MSKYIIFDRDGTLIEHVHYLVDSEKVVFASRFEDSLELFLKLNFKFGMITNQSVIGRGIGTIAQVESINNLIKDKFLAAGAKLDFVFYCPHIPENQCNCRKPRQFFAEIANRDYGVNSSESYLIGDSESDMEFGHYAGYTPLQVNNKSNKSFYAEAHFQDLLGAAEYISVKIQSENKLSKGI
jgi:D-glycero-D-manno-heptose 1,7-bisphosphate phosphatase